MFYKKHKNFYTNGKKGRFMSLFCFEAHFRFLDGNTFDVGGNPTLLSGKYFYIERDSLSRIETGALCFRL